MVVQAYWALVNASVDVGFGKRNFGYIIAGSQIGSILGPTIATQSDRLGVPVLYLSGSVVMFCIISVMHLYISRFGVPDDNNEDSNPTTQSSTAAAASSSNIGDIKKPISNVGGKTTDKKEKKKGGMMEGFYLLAKYEFVQGIFFISSLFMVNVTVIDYMMKVRFVSLSLGCIVFFLFLCTSFMIMTIAILELIPHPTPPLHPHPLIINTWM
jgi:ATP:ADP antiporter, AAA family